MIHLGNGALAALSYGFSSIIITVSNKYVLSVYNFNFPCLITLSHMIACTTISYVLKAAGIIQFADWNFRVASKILPVAILNVINIAVSMAALERVNIPMFTALRRLTVLFVMIFQWKLNGIVPSKQIALSVALMVIGAIIGGAGDLTFDVAGYCWVLLNNALTAGYLSWIKKVEKAANLDDKSNSVFGTVFYNSVLAIPMLCLGAFFSGELMALPTFPHLHDLSFWVCSVSCTTC